MNILQWNNFYLLVGTAAASLMGLTFVAVTVGQKLLASAPTDMSRAFVYPIFSHFVQVFLMCCLASVPVATETVLGVGSVSTGLARLLALIGVYRQVKRVHQTRRDLELSDWLLDIVFPLFTYFLMVFTGVCFLIGRPAAWIGLAVVTLSLMMIGVVSAWEMVLWMVTKKLDEETAPQ